MKPISPRLAGKGPACGPNSSASDEEEATGSVDAIGDADRKKEIRKQEGSYKLAPGKVREGMPASSEDEDKG